MNKLVLATVMILLVWMYAFKIRSGDNHHNDNQGGNGTYTNSTGGWINGTDSNSTAWGNDWPQDWDTYYPYGGYNGTDGNNTQGNNTHWQ